MDTLTNDIVIFAEDRTRRPIDKVITNDEKEICTEYEKECPFCKGNENWTPGETFLIEDNGEWVCKSIYNKFPILDKTSDNIKGTHEVIIESSKHNKTFYNMDKKDFENILTVYKNRYEDLIKDKDVKYVSIFKNFLRKAGASLQHPHSQIVSMPIIPPEVKNELNVAEEYYGSKGVNLYEDIINKELEFRKRVVHNSENFLVIIPYATKYNGEVRILFKDNKRFEEISLYYIEELANILELLFKNIYNERGYMPFNLFLHTHPINEKTNDYFNVHIHIVPRRYSFGGFELSTGMYVSSTNAEELAQKIKF